MPGKIEIKPATLFAASWIASNMRQIDKDEIYCQMHEPTPAKLAHLQLNLSPRFAYQALINDEPVMAFGVAEFQPGLGHLWAYGTKRMYGAIKRVTEFINHDIHKEILSDSSVHRVECRTISTHKASHRWLEQIGLKFITDLPCYGKNAEDFKLYALTRNEVGYVQLTPGTTARSGTKNRKRRRAKAKKRGRR